MKTFQEFLDESEYDSDSDWDNTSAAAHAKLAQMHRDLAAKEKSSSKIDVHLHNAEFHSKAAKKKAVQ